jgi:Tfp pilus assembly protein PilV
MKVISTTTRRGMSILEVLIGATIITVGILALITAYNVYVKYALSNDKKVQATYLLEEGIEVVTLLRDSSWTNFIVPMGTATTSLYWNSSSWRVSSTTNEYIDSFFVRNVKLSAVNRDANGRIASSGTNDADTRLVTVTVSYPDRNGTTTETLSKYLMNIYSN